MKHSPGKTPAFRGPHGEPISGSIAEIRYLRLGGVDQWVLIRGECVANPILSVAMDVAARTGRTINSAECSPACQRAIRTTLYASTGEVVPLVAVAFCVLMILPVFRRRSHIAEIAMQRT
jgi:hypothetical protein